MARLSNEQASEIPIPSASFLVSVLALRWNAELGEQLTPLRITPAEYAVLAHVDALTASGITPNQRQLADASHLEPMYVSKLARRLESGGLLRRDRDNKDPRALRLAITSRGSRILHQARAIAVNLELQRLASIGGATNQPAAQLRATLQTLLQDAETGRQIARSFPSRNPRELAH